MVLWNKQQENHHKQSKICSPFCYRIQTVRYVFLRVGFIDLALRSRCACPSNSTSQHGRHSKSGDQLISPVTLLDSLTRPKLVGVLNEPHQGFPSRPPCLELLKEIITYFIDHSWEPHNSDYITPTPPPLFVDLSNWLTARLSSPGTAAPRGLAKRAGGSRR